MNYKLLLLTIAMLSCGTLSATDETVPHDDHSHLGSDGYFRPIAHARDISWKPYTLSPDTALTLHVPFRRKGPYPDLKQFLLDPANNEIFNNAKAFGILTDDGCKPYYVVLNNNKTYIFRPDSKTGTAPCHYEDQERNIKSGWNAFYKGQKHLHILGYNTNASIISQVFDQIRKKGGITEELFAQLNEPIEAERAEILAAVASAVAATSASGKASAGAGSGSAVPAP